MISPTADVSTWKTPGDRPPLHARLLYYQLEVEEFALLSAAVECSSEGLHISAGTKTMAWLSNLEEKQVQRAINGSGKDRRKGRTEKLGLLRKGILVLKTKENRARGIPPVYVFNEAACQFKNLKELFRINDGASQTDQPWDKPCDKKPPINDAASQTGDLSDAASQINDAASTDSKTLNSISTTDSKSKAYSGASPREKTARGETRSRAKSFPPRRAHDPDSVQTEAKAIARTLAEHIDLVATSANIDSLVAALDHVSTKHNITMQGASEYLKVRARNARETGNLSVYSGKPPRFFFEDGLYEDERYAPTPEGGHQWARGTAYPTCPQHPESGLTDWGKCWACYAAKYGELLPCQERDRSVSACSLHPDSSRVTKLETCWECYWAKRVTGPRPQRHARLKASADPDCVVCEGDGWKVVTPEGDRTPLHRCDCVPDDFDAAYQERRTA